jgi:hypothetical protein
MISFCCSECGEEMEIGRKMAGKRVRCVKCGEKTDVPMPAKRRKYTEEEKELLHSVKEKAARAMREEEEREAENSHSHLYVSTAKGRFWGAEVSLIGGIIMIIAAIAWFIGGLFADRIFFYPPFMFIGGVVAVVRGCMNLGGRRKKRKRRRRSSSE